VNAVKMPEWLERAPPGQLAVFLSKEASPRKSGLFIRHLCRCFPEVFRDPRSLSALDAADRYEAGELDQDEFQTALQAADEAMTRAQSEYDPWSAGQDAGATRIAGGAAAAARIAHEVSSQGFYPGVLSRLRHAILDLAGAGGGPRKNPTARAMRPVFFEHFGNPFRPVTLKPAWRTTTTVQLAQGMYESRDFGAMPILADALQDAGCDSADILDHCRGPGPHIRGCWVVDLVLGKA
jgi:hypothetical protein